MKYVPLGSRFEGTPQKKRPLHLQYRGGPILTHAYPNPLLERSQYVSVSRQVRYVAEPGDLVIKVSMVDAAGPQTWETLVYTVHGIDLP